MRFLFPACNPARRLLICLCDPSLILSKKYLCRISSELVQVLGTIYSKSSERFVLYEMLFYGKNLRWFSENSNIIWNSKKQTQT